MQKTELSATNHALQACARVLRPIVRLALERGLKYQDIDAVMRELMLDEATRDYRQRHGKKPSGSQLSVTTGINRKEVKRLTETPENTDLLAYKSESLTAQVFFAWIDGINKQLISSTLPILHTDDSMSFQSLCNSVVKDVHFRSVLDELTRLGMTLENGGHVELTAQEFIPRRDSQMHLQLAAENAAAHLNSIAHNLENQKNAYLEQAMWVDQISLEDCQQLHALSKECWDKSRLAMRPPMQTMYEKRNETAQPYQVRIGMYCYMEPIQNEKESV
jgi:hypothetical protein